MFFLSFAPNYALQLFLLSHRVVTESFRCCLSLNWSGGKDDGVAKWGGVWNMSTVDEREREREREREKPLCRTMTSLCEPQLGKVVLSFFRDGQRFQQSASEAARGRGRWGRGGGCGRFFFPTFTWCCAKQKDIECYRITRRSFYN